MSKSKQNNPASVVALKSPAAADLKTRFQAQSIPLESDFAQLIDMADAGYLAVGRETGTPGEGLALDQGKLKVKAGNGITVAAGGVEVKPNAALGITVDGNGVGIKTDKKHGTEVDSNDKALKVALSGTSGLTRTETGLAVKTPNGSAISLRAEGIAVKVNTAKGIVIEEDQLALKPNVALGIKVDGSGVGINTSKGNGLDVASNALKVAVSGTNPGLELKSDGLALHVQKGSGVTVGKDGLGIDAVRLYGLAIGATEVGEILGAYLYAGRWFTGGRWVQFVGSRVKNVEVKDASSMRIWWGAPEGKERVAMYMEVKDGQWDDFKRDADFSVQVAWGASAGGKAKWRNL